MGEKALTLTLTLTLTQVRRMGEKGQNFVVKQAAKQVDGSTWTTRSKCSPR